MFLFEKSLIGAYGNRLYDLGERYAMAKLKQKAQTKILTSQISIRKQGHQIVK